MKKILIVFFVISTFLYAIPKDKIEVEMGIKINSISTILKDTTLTNGDKKQKLYNLLDDVFDFELMAKISLGRAYNLLSKEQQVEFVKLFVDKLKKSYLDKIDLYNGQDLVINGISQIKDDRINLLTQVKGANEDFDITYKFYPKSDNWLIYDIDIIGVSIVQTYRKQFGEFLSTKTLDDLMASLR